MTPKMERALGIIADHGPVDMDDLWSKHKVHASTVTALRKRRLVALSREVRGGWRITVSGRSTLMRL